MEILMIILTVRFSIIAQSCLSGHQIKIRVSFLTSRPAEFDKDAGSNANATLNSTFPPNFNHSIAHIAQAIRPRVSGSILKSPTIILDDHPQSLCAGADPQPDLGRAGMFDDILQSLLDDQEEVVSHVRSHLTR